MRKRFDKIKRSIVHILVEQDVLGKLEKSSPLRLLHAPTTNLQDEAWRFQTDSQKIKSFRDWLSDQVDQGVLDQTATGKPWTNTYIDSAYKKGIARAYIDSNSLKAVEAGDFFEGSKEQFLRSAFINPEVTSKLELLYTRVFTNLEGVTAAMDTRLSQVLSLGLANGDNPRTIAKEIAKQMDTLKKRAETIARTEIIYAHAEGQLDSFSLLGIEEIGVQAEWSTAGDDRVCPQCAAQEGKLFTIEEARGLIPLHPNCRCTWVPVPSKQK